MQIFKGEETLYFLHLAYISPVKLCFGKDVKFWSWLRVGLFDDELVPLLKPMHFIFLLTGKNCNFIPEKEYREHPRKNNPTRIQEENPQ